MDYFEIVLVRAYQRATLDRNFCNFHDINDEAIHGSSKVLTIHFTVQINLFAVRFNRVEECRIYITNKCSCILRTFEIPPLPINCEVFKRYTIKIRHFKSLSFHEQD